MKYSVDKQSKYTVFKLEEENFNSVLAPQMKTELKRLEDEGTPNLILDMSAVKYTDSSGLSAILTGRRLIEEDQAGTFVVVTPIDGMVMRLMKISQLHNQMTILPTLDEAIEYVFMEEIEREFSDNEGEDEEDDQKTTANQPT